jgi:hypothetical protein
VRSGIRSPPAAADARATGCLLSAGTKVVTASFRK